MPTYKVVRQSDGAVVHPGYRADQPISWHGMEFETHDHVEVSEPLPDGPINSPVVYVWSQVEFLRRFTAPERVAIRAVAAGNPDLADFLDLLDKAQEVRSDDPDTVAAVQMLEHFGLLVAGRAAQILGGA